jgi:methoxymalonate biosynthesis acyl carrier protein
MQLVLHIEAEYGIAVSNDDLDLDNFRSLQAIAGFVGRKRGD